MNKGIAIVSCNIIPATKRSSCNKPSSPGLPYSPFSKCTRSWPLFFAFLHVFCLGSHFSMSIPQLRCQLSHVLSSTFLHLLPVLLHPLGVTPPPSWECSSAPPFYHCVSVTHITTTGRATHKATSHTHTHSCTRRCSHSAHLISLSLSTSLCLLLDQRQRWRWKLGRRTIIQPQLNCIYLAAGAANRREIREQLTEAK